MVPQAAHHRGWDSPSTLSHLLAVAVGELDGPGAAKDSVREAAPADLDRKYDHRLLFGIAISSSYLSRDPRR